MTLALILVCLWPSSRHCWLPSSQSFPTLPSLPADPTYHDGDMMETKSRCFLSQPPLQWGMAMWPSSGQYDLRGGFLGRFWIDFPPSSHLPSATSGWLFLLFLIPSSPPALLPTPPPFMPVISWTSAKSSLENSFDQVVFLLSTTPPPDARESLKTFSLACKAFQDLVLKYLSYFLPWDLLSYPSAWPKGDKCFPCVLVQVLQNFEEQVIQKKETDLHWLVLLPCSRWS